MAFSAAPAPNLDFRNDLAHGRGGGCQNFPSCTFMTVIRNFLQGAINELSRNVTLSRQQIFFAVSSHPLLST